MTKITRLIIVVMLLLLILSNLSACGKKKQIDFFNETELNSFLGYSSVEEIAAKHNMEPEEIVAVIDPDKNKAYIEVLFPDTEYRLLVDTTAKELPVFYKNYLELEDSNIEVDNYMNGVPVPEEDKSIQLRVLNFNTAEDVRPGPRAIRVGDDEKKIQTLFPDLSEKYKQEKFVPASGITKRFYGPKDMVIDKNIKLKAEDKLLLGGLYSEFMPGGTIGESVYQYSFVTNDLNSNVTSYEFGYVFYMVKNSKVKSIATGYYFEPL